MLRQLVRLLHYQSDPSGSGALDDSTAQGVGVRRCTSRAIRYCPGGCIDVAFVWLGGSVKVRPGFIATYVLACSHTLH